MSMTESAATASPLAAKAGPAIGYDHWRTGLTTYRDYLAEVVRTFRPKRICEVGGGASPTFPLDFVAEHELAYTVLDVSLAELDKAPAGYDKWHADITTVDATGREPYDLVFSHMVAEHVKSPRALHRNVRALLRPGGLAVHLFPTLFEPAFIANRLFPERLTGPLLRAVQPHRVTDSAHGKFPAYYRWCRGPTPKQLRRFTSLGYDVVDYVGYFGTGYTQRIPVLGQLDRRRADFLIAHPRPGLTAYTRVTLRAA
jgi:SAM-dependent methyltransferase